MDLRKLKKLIDLVEESGISELELTEGEESVRISRQGQVVQQPQQYTIPQQPTPSLFKIKHQHQQLVQILKLWLKNLVML